MSPSELLGALKAGQREIAEQLKTAEAERDALADDLCQAIARARKAEAERDKLRGALREVRRIVASNSNALPSTRLNEILLAAVAALEGK